MRRFGLAAPTGFVIAMMVMAVNACLDRKEISYHLDASVGQTTGQHIITDDPPAARPFRGTPNPARLGHIKKAKKEEPREQHAPRPRQESDRAPNADPFVDDDPGIIVHPEQFFGAIADGHGNAYSADKHACRAADVRRN